MSTKRRNSECVTKDRAPMWWGGPSAVTIINSIHAESIYISIFSELCAPVPSGTCVCVVVRVDVATFYTMAHILCSFFFCHFSFCDRISVCVFLSTPFRHIIRFIARPLASPLYLLCTHSLMYTCVCLSVYLYLY